MTRPFDFSDSVSNQAYFRQHGLCAVCGEELTDLEENAHHVIPNQTGIAGRKSDAWLAFEDNCVVLCKMCHYRVHEDGHYCNGATAPTDYFEYSHALDQAAHASWARRIALR